MTRSPVRRGRRGFTLVELLVVMVLIATLSAITVGAVFRVRAAQSKSFSEATVSKVDGLLVKKLKAIQEQVKDQRRKKEGHFSVVVSNVPNNNEDVAEAVLIYMKTRNELPMTFAEAKAATAFAGVNLPPSPLFAALPNGTGAPEESAVLLYLALAPLNEGGLDQQVGEVPTMPGFKCFIDAYGQPLYFNRLAFNGDNGELDAPPFVKPGAVFDPFFPKHVNGTYRNLATEFTAANANALWQAVVPPASTYTAANNWALIPGINAAAPFYTYPGLKNHTAAVISSGADKDLLSPPGLFAGDNLVSYRLRKEGGKGD